MGTNYIEGFLVKSSNEILSKLSSPTVPDWTNVKDLSLPAKPTAYCLVYEPVVPEGENRSIKVGDKLNVAYTVYPQVRLDGNVTVKFHVDEINVVRVVDKLESIITGLSRLSYIRKAKSALGKDFVKVEVTGVYECINSSPYSLCPLKIVGDITVKRIKI